MAPDKETFLKFSDLVYKYVDETESRVPISDWHYTESGNMVGFRARSVIGGYWMKVLMDSFEPKVLPPTGIDNVASSDGESKIKACYNAVGQAINAPMKGLNIVEYANGEVRKVFICTEKCGLSGSECPYFRDYRWSCQNGICSRRAVYE